jgi:hypothetical protein
MLAPRSMSRVLGPLSLAIGGLWSSSCAPGGFADPAVVSSVRVIASSADTPYARPGDEVNLQLLAYDGRKAKATPMSIFWLPFVCENPVDDAYFGCFAQLAGRRGTTDGGTDAAAGGGLAPGVLRPGVDLTPLLPSGPAFHFTMPADAVASHAASSQIPTAGLSAPYGLTIVFNLACAGHVELVPIDPGNVNPQAIPIGCFDANHNRLGPDDYVFGFTRVFAYSDPTVTNANPVVKDVDIKDKIQDQTMTVESAPGGYTTAGFRTGHCTADRREKCPHIKIGPEVPLSSWEINPEDTDQNGNVRHEQIWADYFTTFGGFTSDARLLYDTTIGSPGDASKTDTEFLPPYETGSGFIWIVVHDNRGGAAWVTIPVQID